MLALAILLYVLAYLRWPPLLWVQLDLQVYRFGAAQVWKGLDLYSIGLTGNRKELLFVYPPFAALLFLPLVVVPEPAIQVLWLMLGCLLVVYSVRRMLRSMGLATAHGLWSLTALLVGLVSWLEPLRLSLELGQINIAILALVLTDLIGPVDRRLNGMGIGVAAAIKLTPAIFIVYLVVIRRLRAAAVATATLAATVVIGFALLPADSAFWWLQGGFDNPDRIAQNPYGSAANTTVSGLLIRFHVPGTVAAVVAISLLCIALILGAIAHRRGHDVLAVALVGMAAAAASPFSWCHHWVWFAPLLAHLGYRAYIVRSKCSMWALWILAALLGGWFTALGDHREDAVLSLRPGHAWNKVVPGMYVFVFLAAMVCTAAWLWRSAATPGPRQKLRHWKVGGPEGLRLFRTPKVNSAANMPEAAILRISAIRSLEANDTDLDGSGLRQMNGER